jgi:hypothetical protein
MANGIEVTVSVETVVVIGEGHAAWEVTHVNDHLGVLSSYKNFSWPN